MGRAKGKGLAWVSLAFALGVGVGALMVCKGILLEKWYLLCLNSKNESVGAAAVDGLVGLRSAKVVPHLIDVLNTADRWQQVAAIRSLETIGPNAEAAAHTLSQLLLKVNPPSNQILIVSQDSVRVAAEKALVSIGPQVLPVFLETFVQVGGHQDFNKASGAARVLQLWGPASVPPLIEWLQNQDEHFRSAAAFLLGNLGAAAVPRLVSSFQTGDEPLRLWAARTLGMIGAEAEAAIPSLVDGLSNKDEDKEVRMEALRALKNIGTTTLSARSQIIPAALDFLKSEPDGRTLAADALVSFGPQTAPSVLDLLREDDARMWFWARLILWQLGKQAPVHRLLVGAREDQDVRFRDRVQEILDLIGHWHGEDPKDEEASQR